jgi:serine phosphatase RsbU (regulator of sigma subunit)
MQLSPSDARDRDIGVDESGFRWPLAFMRLETFKKGEWLFKMGDRAEKLFYVVKGLIRLPERDILIRPGQVIGEMGLFSPTRQRSASALAAEDVDAYTMGGEEVRSLMSRDPGLATSLIEVVIKRMMERLRAELEARERIQAELRIARDIQISMLPRVFPPFPGRKDFELYALMEPANEVGGDLYDFFLVDEHRLCVLVGDVSGKGVPAALLMALCKTLLRSEAKRGYPAREILARVNNLVCSENQEGMFVTVFCLLLNTRTGEAECCSAGHNPPLLCSRDGALEFLDAEPGSVIGFEENFSYTPKLIRFEPGDILLLYTDGVTEAENPLQEQFSPERLSSSLSALRHRDVQEIIAGVRQEVALHAKGQPQSDDITLVVLKYNGSASQAEVHGRPTSQS